jgi:nardilysin
MLLKEELNEYVYPATLAGLSFNVQALRSGLEVKVSGFSQKLRMLALSVVERAVKFTPNEDVFQIQMERLARFYTSMHFEAGTLGESIRLVIQQSTRFPLVLLRAALPDVSFSSVIALRQELFSALWLNVFAHGNIQANQALDLYHAVRFIVSWQAVPQALQFSDRCVNLPEKCNFVFAQPGCNPDDNNSYVESFFQVGIDTFELRTMLHFLSYVRFSIMFHCLHATFGDCILTNQICYEPCFDQLRTRDQLGYNVGCCQRNTSGILGFGVQVISALQSPAFIDQRIESFLADFSKTLRQLSAKEFADHVQSYITQKEPDHNLEDEAARYWDEICDKTYVFDRPAREAKYIREHVTQASLSAFYDQHIAPLPNSQRRKLGLWVFAAGRELSSSAMSIDTNAVVPPHWPVSGPAFPLLPSETLDPQTGIAGGAESEFGGAKRIVDWVQFKRSLPLFPDLSS